MRVYFVVEFDPIEIVVMAAASGAGLHFEK
jgi:hypothetical protein